MKNFKNTFLAGLLAWGLAAGAQAQPAARVTVDVDKPGIALSPLLYGIFFEEINRAGDGGIYAEMIQNRSFEDARNLFHDDERRRELGEAADRQANDPIAWSPVKSAKAEGSVTLDRNLPLNKQNPTSLRLTVIEVERGGRVGVANDGFRGIPINTPVRMGAADLGEWRRAFEAADNGGLHVEKGKRYDLSLYARAGRKAGPLTVTLERADGTVLARQSVSGLSPQWKKFTATLVPGDTDSKARLVVSADASGIYWLDMVSLFPRDTWKGRKNGLRADLMERIAALKPAFVRFPGGCFVEGYYYGEYPRWKESIGDIAARPEDYAYWGYALTNGLGFHEYLQMCEDLGAEPLFVINVGMHHAGRRGGVVAVPMEQMGPFVQDALDAIEYANGSVTSRWGALRARNGHPKPFNLKYMEIGNENGGPAYHQRYALFNDAIKKRYPNVELVACDWQGIPNNRPLDLIDSHHYGDPASFLRMTTRYDAYDRGGPKVYFGEYAVTQRSGRGNLQAAVAEAAFLTGLERNSDIVTMSSYAPLLVRQGWDRWNPNAIVFDQARVYGTPSYHLQTLFAANRPGRILPVQIENAVQSAPPIQGRIGVGTWATQAEFKDIKVTKGDQVLFQSDFSQGLGEWRTRSGQWQVVDGALRQSGNEEGSLALIGDPSWQDYTLTLKARKTGGNEGFLIVFGAPARFGGGTTNWWNIGGWNNTAHMADAPGVLSPRVPGRIETGRWYDIKVELQGATARFYLDGQLIHTAARTNPPTLHAVAGRDERTGETILKVVNASDQPVQADVELRGGRSGSVGGRAWVLTSAGPEDENSFEAPTKIAPREEPIQAAAPRFSHTFPADSVTVLRLKSGR